VKTVQIEVPDEVVELIGSEQKIQEEAKEALLLNLVRKGMISRSKAAELLGVSLWDLPQVLARYEIPWFHYRKQDVEADLELLKRRRG
jgi:predicted HTH domain antitoxin